MLDWAPNLHLQHTDVPWWAILLERSNGQHTRLKQARSKLQLESLCPQFSVKASIFNESPLFSQIGFSLLIFYGF
jgi:hypothetical protein